MYVRDMLYFVFITRSIFDMFVVLLFVELVKFGFSFNNHLDTYVLVIFGSHPKHHQSHDILHFLRVIGNGQNQNWLATTFLCYTVEVFT